MLKVYTYQNCSTCRNAVKWLRARDISFAELPIRSEPPPVAELEKALKALGSIRLLLNTSGQDYRSLGLKDKLAEMDEKSVLKLLATNGNLIKRPLAVDGSRGIYLSGFKEAEWAARLVPQP